MHGVRHHVKAIRPEVRVHVESLRGARVPELELDDLHVGSARDHHRRGCVAEIARGRLLGIQTSQSDGFGPDAASPVRLVDVAPSGGTEDEGVRLLAFNQWPKGDQWYLLQAATACGGPGVACTRCCRSSTFGARP